MSAREFFESVREASREIDLIRSQLERIESNALRVSSATFEPHISTGRTHGLDGRVAAMIDGSAKLERVLEADYDLIDKANAVLYGTDYQDGLCKLVTPWWCDAISMYYIDGMSWGVVARMMGRSRVHVSRCAHAALDVADAYGLTDTVAGRGIAEG